MAVYIECLSCRRKNPLTRKTCPRCNAPIPPGGRPYWIEYRVRGRKKLERLGVLSLAAARGIEAERKRAVREGTLRQKTAPITWDEVTQAYVRKLESEQSGGQYLADSRRYLEQMGAFWGEGCAVQEITPTMIREFLVGLRARGLKEPSVNRYLAAGRAACNYSCDEIPNPFKRVHAYNEREHLETPELTRDERKRFFEAARTISDQFYRIAVVLFGTGLRKSNVLNLKRGEVDFGARLIRVKQKRNRTLEVPLRKDVERILKQIPDDGSGYYFANPRTSEPYTVWWRNAWNKAIKLAKITRRFTFHGARHDFGMRAYQATGDILAVQKLLGHSQLSTTQRYIRTLPRQMQKAADKIEMPPTMSPTKKGNS